MIAMMPMIIAIIAIVFVSVGHSTCVEASWLACSSRRPIFSSGSVINRVSIARPVKSKPKAPLALIHFSRYFPAAVAKTYVVTFRSHNDDRPPKFIVIANDRKSAITMAWEHGGADFQARFDRSSGQAQPMKEGHCGFYEIPNQRRRN